MMMRTRADRRRDSKEPDNLFLLLRGQFTERLQAHP
jgi:hypothetical protein